MSPGLLLAFVGFAFVSTITPGPNNAMLLASGLNYGFRRTIPHVAGVTFGCVAMLLLVGFGLGEIFTASPVIYEVLRYAGAAYLLWLAWRIASAGPVTPGGGGGRPMGFWAAAGFQWVNPKAWIVVVGAVTTYAPRDGFQRNVVALAVLLGLVGVPSVCLWAGCGTALRPLLSHPRRVRVFNITMALLLALCVLPILGGWD